jgi:molybdopterin/thiamine biosynthesis adenylyltransferase
MIENLSERYLRQYGLVYQDKLANLNILIKGDNEVLPFLLLNLAFCGAGSLQGGVYLDDVPDTVQDYHLQNPILFNPADKGKPFLKALRRIFRKEPYDERDAQSIYFKYNLHPLAPDFDVQKWPDDGFKHIIPDVVIYLPTTKSPVKKICDTAHVSLVGQVTPAGFYVGNEIINIENIETFEPNILTQSLASLCGSILCQEVIRLTNCIREYFILDQSMEILCRIKSETLRDWKKTPEAPLPFEARFRLGEELINTRIVSYNKDDDEVLVSLVLPKNSLTTRLITDSIEIVEEPLRKTGGLRDPLFFSFVEGEKLDTKTHSVKINEEVKIPTRLDSLKALVLGVGGIGTWLCALLAISPIKNLQLALIDHDARVEEHNLNRQILYTIHDIGKSKAEAASDSLKRLNSHVDIHPYQFEFQQIILKYLDKNATEEYQLISKDLLREKSDIEDKLNAMLANDFIEAQVVLSCPDNFFTRLIINAACFLKKKVMINAGIGEGFFGSVDYYEPQDNDACLIQRYGKNTMMKVERQQCGGSLPIPSIVTTNSFVASVQSILALLKASGIKPKVNLINYDGKNFRFNAIKFQKIEGENIESVTNELLSELD